MSHDTATPARVSAPPASKAFSTDAVERYRLLVARRVLVLAALLLGLAALVVAALCVGGASIGWREALRAVAAGPADSVERGGFARVVVWQLRLPRISMGILGGAALGLAGAMMQGLLRNPLASPFTLGVASASGFGAALAITLGVGVAGWGQWLIIGNAFLFAMLASLAVFVLAQWRGMSKETMILAGVATMYLFSALTSLLQYVGEMEEVHSVVFWLMGSLERATWHRTGLVAIACAITLPWMYSLSWDLNAMASGDESARSLGVSAKRVRTIGMFLASLATASVICFSGTIGFIGLVAPHISRMLVGVDHRFHMPASMLTGAALLVGADAAARAVFAPHVLPLGIMTSCVGVPFFFYLVARHRKDIWRS